MRYFFDYRLGDRSLYDYRGDEFNSSKSAIEFATEIAHLLSESLSGEWDGWSVEVREPGGAVVFQMRVAEPRPVAA